MTIPDSLTSALRAVNDIFERRVIKARDFAAVRDVYTSGARILPPGADLVEGHDGIAKFWHQAVTSLNVLGASLHTLDARNTGTSIIEVGHADLLLAGAQTVAIKYVVEWQEDRGVWKWHTDIWNTNQ